MKILLTIVFTIVVVVVIGFAFIYSGLYNVAAINPSGQLESWFFSTVMDNSVEHHSDGIIAPSLSDAAIVDSGFQAFDLMCVGCHGEPGGQPLEKNVKFNPSPPDLSEAVGDQSDAEIFWIVKNGIKMTGMPAFGTLEDDNHIWEAVSFVHLLPKMTQEQYKSYKKRLGQAEHP